MRLLLQDILYYVYSTVQYFMHWRLLDQDFAGSGLTMTFHFSSFFFFLFFILFNMEIFIYSLLSLFIYFLFIQDVEPMDKGKESTETMFDSQEEDEAGDSGAEEIGKLLLLTIHDKFYTKIRFLS